MRIWPLELQLGGSCQETLVGWFFCQKQTWSKKYICAKFKYAKKHDLEFGLTHGWISRNPVSCGNRQAIGCRRHQVSQILTKLQLSNLELMCFCCHIETCIMSQSHWQNFCMFPFMQLSRTICIGTTGISTTGIDWQTQNKLWILLYKVFFMKKYSALFDAKIWLPQARSAILFCSDSLWTVSKEPPFLPKPWLVLDKVHNRCY